MNRFSAIARVAAALTLSAWLAACASTGPAPVQDLSLGSRQSAHSTANAPSTATRAATGSRYVVQRGDTLYSIAFRHGVDYRELAGWNRINPPYTIYVGQALAVSGGSVAQVRTQPTIARSGAQPPAPPASGASAAAKPAPSGVPAPAPFENVTAQSMPSSAPEQETVRAPAATAPQAVPAATPEVAARATAPEPRIPSNASEAAPPAAARVATSGEISWRWPATGAVVGNYVAGDQTKQGIDIAGNAGDPVRAAADGSVVYSGNGLIGYGELIIVKHSPAYLSAYGHNRKRLVKEGDHVSAGQVIAEMGSSSANRDLLHFEIRKNGKPVNPTDYLPRR